MGGARLENEDTLKLTWGIIEIEKDWCSCISKRISGSSCSRPTLAWTKWQEIQSKSTWDESRSWSCRGLPNKTMMLKQIANTIVADLDLVKFNLIELKGIQLPSLFLIYIRYISRNKDSIWISAFHTKWTVVSELLQSNKIIAFNFIPLYFPLDRYSQYVLVPDKGEN